LIGHGGTNTKFEVREGRVTESVEESNIHAYLLVYVREGERADILEADVGLPLSL
jgi:hypothetical protein